MKRAYPTTSKGKANSWHKHLRPYMKRKANKGTRIVLKQMLEQQYLNPDKD